MVTVQRKPFADFHLYESEQESSRRRVKKTEFSAVNYYHRREISPSMRLKFLVWYDWRCIMRLGFRKQGRRL